MGTSLLPSLTAGAPRTAADASAALPTGMSGPTPLLDVLKNARAYIAKTGDKSTADQYVQEETQNRGNVGSVEELDQATRLDAPAAAFNLLGGIPFMDRGMAALATLAGKIPGLQDYAGHQSYPENLASVRREQGLMRSAHPLATALENIEGSLLLPFKGPKTAGPGVGFFPSALKTGAVGGGVGGLYGLSATPDFTKFGSADVARTAAGAVFGGVPAAMLGGAGHFLGHATTPQASTRLETMLEEAAQPGQSPEQVLRAAAAKLTSGDQPLIPGALTPSTRRAAEFAAQANDAVLSEAEPKMNALIAGAPGRLKEDIADLFQGAEPNATARGAQLTSELQQIGDRYEPLEQAAPTLKGTPAEGAAQATLELAKNGVAIPRANALAQKALESGEYGDYNKLRKALRAQQDKGFSGTSALGKDEAADIRTVADQLDGTLADHVPGYAAVQRDYAAKAGQIRALGDAEQFNPLTTDFRQLQAQWASLPPGEQEEFRHGLASQVVDRLNRVKEGKDAAVNFAHPDANTANNLQLVFGPQGYARFHAAAERENMLGQLRNTALAGSRTAGRQMEQAEPHPLTETARMMVTGEGIRPQAFARFPLGPNKAAAAQKAAGQMGPLLFNPAQDVDAFLAAVKATRGPGWQRLLQALARNAGRLAQPTGTAAGLLTQPQP